MNTARRGSGQWFFGLIILIFGVIFLLENLFAMEIWEKVRLFWPILLLIWGLLELFQKKAIFFGMLIIALGAIFLIRNFEIYQLPAEIWKYWPVIIIAIGIDHLFKRSESSVVGHIDKKKQKDKKGNKEVFIQDDEII